MVKKPFLIAVLAVVLLFSSLGMAYASPLSEISGYWALTYGASQLQYQSYGLMEDLGILGKYKADLLAKAAPDEWFVKIGESYPITDPQPLGAIPKKNQAYVWGLTKAGNQLWFGTIANTLSLVMGGYLGMTTPVQTESFVAEFGKSRLCTQPPFLPAAIGDWRPPRLYAYDLTTKQLTDKTPTAGIAAALINSTTGIRSAGSLGNLVLFAGPSLNPTQGLNVFAFRADTGALIGATTLSDYNDIRKWLEVDGVLYTTVGNRVGGGGSVLRWKGTLANPLAFEVVGNLDSMGANIAVHQNRLFVTTWPGKGVAGLYMGPVIPYGGLTSSNASQWKKVWQVSDYEPDTITASTYGGGDLYSYNGYLYWGTMHVPMLSASAATKMHDKGLINLDTNGNGTLDNDELITTFLGSYRPISIFRGKGFGTFNQSVDIVYGQEYLPVYDAAKKSYTIAKDAAHLNKMKKDALQGPAGCGNFYNAYTWTMMGYDGKLFIGTFDWSYVFSDLLGTVMDSGTTNAFPAMLMPSKATAGADLYSIDGWTGKATPESVKGVGNITNYGIRTMLTDNNALYLGMANPMNIDPKGGWELLKLYRR